MKKILSLVLLVLIAWAAEAQILTPVKWKITLDDSDSSVKTLLFSAKLEKGWHLYDMNLPDGGPIPTSFNFETLKGAKALGSPVPSKKATTVYDEQFEMNLSWYAQEVSFSQQIEITDPKAFKVDGYVEYMACNDENCLPPEKESFSFNHTNINVEKTLQALAKKNEMQVENLAEEEVRDVHEPETVPAVKQNVSAETGWLFIFFAGFVGGLVALLTPCVWPMIPMTVSFFLKRTKDRKKAIRDALTYGISIIVIYLALGLLITGIFGASALNDLSTHAVFNIIFFLLLVLFAVSFLDEQAGYESGYHHGDNQHIFHVFHVGAGLILLHWPDYWYVVGSSGLDGFESWPGHRHVRFCLGFVHSFQFLCRFPEHASEYAQIRGLAQFGESCAGIFGIGLGVKVPFRCRPCIRLAIVGQGGLCRAMDCHIRSVGLLLVGQDPFQP